MCGKRLENIDILQVAVWPEKHGGIKSSVPLENCPITCDSKSENMLRFSFAKSPAYKGSFSTSSDGDYQVGAMMQYWVISPSSSGIHAYHIKLGLRRTPLALLDSFSPTSVCKETLRCP